MLAQARPRDDDQGVSLAIALVVLLLVLTGPLILGALTTALFSKFARSAWSFSSYLVAVVFWFLLIVLLVWLLW